MKTMKFALIAAILSIALLGYSTDHKTNVVRTINISLEKALDDRGLVREMYIQLDDSFLETENLGRYTARVKYRNQLYVIGGTHKEWVLFFLMDYSIPKEVKSALGSNSRLID
jgi:hypothetical protein